MSVALQQQPVREACPPAEILDAERSGWRRRVIAGPAGLALLLAGGGLLIRVALLTFQNEGRVLHAWLFTAVACVLAGVALVLIALPKIVTAERGDEEPTLDSLE